MKHGQRQQNGLTKRERKAALERQRNKALPAPTFANLTQEQRIRLGDILLGPYLGLHRRSFK